MRENLVYLIPSEDDRKARRLLRPFHSVQPTKFPLKNVFIKKEQRAERLILGGGRHPAITGEMGKKRAHFRFTHFSGMTHRVKTDKALDPIPIRSFRTQAVVLKTHDIAHLIDQFWIWLALARESGKRCGMTPSYTGGSLDGKRTRRRNSVKKAEKPLPLLVRSHGAW